MTNAEKYLKKDTDIKKLAKIINDYYLQDIRLNNLSKDFRGGASVESSFLYFMREEYKAND